MQITHVDEFLSDVRSVVRVRIVGIHVLNCLENTLRVQSVVILPDVIFHHLIEKLPPNVVSRSQTFIVICKRLRFEILFIFKKKRFSYISCRLHHLWQLQSDIAALGCTPGFHKHLQQVLAVQQNHLQNSSF